MVVGDIDRGIYYHNVRGIKMESKRVRILITALVGVLLVVAGLVIEWEWSPALFGLGAGALLQVGQSLWDERKKPAS